MVSQLQKPLHYDQHEHIDHAPLVEVICQISYPPILKINDGIDSKIQDFLPDWPQYEQIMEPVFIDNEKNTPIAQFTSNHQFSNSETLERINIRNDSIAFTSNLYKNWDDFFVKIQAVYSAFRSCYGISNISRIGIRYINFVYCDLFTSDSGKTISDFIEDPFAGPIKYYADPNPFIKSYQGDITLDNKAQIFTHLKYGLVSRVLDKKKVFLVDIDVFREKNQSPDQLFSDISLFHEYAYDAFRWVVKYVP